MFADFALGGPPIDPLIDSDLNYVVYVGDDLFVWWNMNDNEMLSMHGDALTRVALLESIKTDYLGRERQMIFKVGGRGSREAIREQSGRSKRHL